MNNDSATTEQTHGHPAWLDSAPTQFQNPPTPARPGAFWPWLNANVSLDRLRYDLEQMKDKGMGGAEIWDVQAMKNTATIPAGPEFLSPESVANIRFALAEGRRLGLRMGMIASSGWNAGGTWVTPDWASKMLVDSATTATGPGRFSRQLAFPAFPKGCPTGKDDLPLFYRDIAVLAVPANAKKTIAHPDQIIDLTAKLKSGGRLDWQVPPGQWQILRFVCTNTGQHLIVPSPKSNGLFIDFLDPDATRRHLKLILDRLGITTQNAAESGLNYLEVDSMELHKGNPWTDKFSGWFQRYRGYDLTKWLPVLAGWTVEDRTSSDAFLYDYKRTVSDLLIHSHYETGTDFLKQYGIEFIGEAGGPGPPIWDTCPVDALKALGNVTVPRGEFWIQHRDIVLVKQIASAAHIYGKPVVDAESFTTWRRWEDPPATLKTLADRAFAEGLNHITIHTFAHSPESAGLPGRAYHAGVDINPNVNWWPFAKPFMDYLARCSWMLRQGLPVADVLWYYGDQAPNFFPAFHKSPEKSRLPGLGRGYDYDVVNSDVILHRLEWNGGHYRLPEGTAYRILALAPDAAVTADVLARLKAFVEAGGVLAGSPPASPPGLHNRTENTRTLRRLSAELWGDQPTTGSRRVGHGRVYFGMKLDDVLAAENVAPDFSVADWEHHQNIDYIHRRTADADIYFLRNDAEKPDSASIRFRGNHPAQNAVQVWNAVTGDVATTSAASKANGSVELRLDLPAGGSQFVVIPRHVEKSGQPSSTDEEKPEPVFHLAHQQEIAGPWELAFTPVRGAPTSVTLQSLKSWTDFTEDGIRFFSGIGTYNAQFELSSDAATSGGKVFLDLGEIGDVARVSVNGADAGIAWTPPYRVEVTKLLRPGKNTVSISVANLWHNRLVGDASLPPKKRITRTNLPLTPMKNAQLRKSGLRGPVSLQWFAP